MLTSITIPESVTSIGSDTFQDCYGLITVYISDTKAMFLGNLDSKTWHSPSTLLAFDFYNAPLGVNLTPIV